MRRLQPGALALVLFLVHGLLLAQPTESGLISAWERGLRADPQTIALENRGSGTYHFATRRFPFDGELKLLKAVVEEPIGDQVAIGTVEVELVGLPEKIREDYGRSYPTWNAENTLFYDLSQKRWLTSREYRQTAMSRARRAASPWLLFSSMWVWLLVLLGIVTYSVFVQRRYGRRSDTALARQREAIDQARTNYEDIRKRQEESKERMKEAAERAKEGLELQKRALAVQEEMLAELRRIAGKP